MEVGRQYHNVRKIIINFLSKAIFIVPEKISSMQEKSSKDSLGKWHSLPEIYFFPQTFTDNFLSPGSFPRESAAGPARVSQLFSHPTRKARASQRVPLRFKIARSLAPTKTGHYRCRYNLCWVPVFQIR